MICEMTIIQEHDIINFSMYTNTGVHRYYGKEVLRKGGFFVVNIDNNDIPVSNVFHIEKIDRNPNCESEITRLKAKIEQVTGERNEYKTLYETMYRKYSDLQDKAFNCEALRKERDEYLNKAVELQKQVDKLKTQKEVSIKSIEDKLTEYYFMGCSYGAIVSGKMSISIAKMRAKEYAPVLYGFIKQSIKDIAKKYYDAINCELQGTDFGWLAIQNKHIYDKILEEE